MLAGTAQQAFEARRGERLDEVWQQYNILNSQFDEPAATEGFHERYRVLANQHLVTEAEQRYAFKEIDILLRDIRAFMQSPNLVKRSFPGDWLFIGSAVGIVLALGVGTYFLLK